MKSNSKINKLLLFFAIIIQIMQNAQQLEEDELRLSTISSLTKINSNLYMLNYQNDYYLDEILKEGVQSLEEVKLFANKKFGINFDFNSEEQKKNKSFYCSSFNVFNKNNENLFARNFDYPHLSPTLVVWTNPKNGYKSISFVNGQYIGIFEEEEKNFVKERLLYSVYDIMDGFNEEGLSLSILRLSQTSGVHQKDPTKKNITSSIMIKGVLDYCKNVFEAIQFFNKYNLQDIDEESSLHYMITDAQGDSIIIEYLDNKMFIIKPYGIEKIKYLYVTNFFLSKPIKEGNNIGLNRFNILKEKIKDDTIMENNVAMNLLNEVKQNSTLWSNIYNTKKLTVITALRRKYDVLFEFNVRKPNKYFKIINFSDSKI